jgi:hypothetical protein
MNWQSLYSGSALGADGAWCGSCGQSVGFLPTLRWPPARSGAHIRPGPDPHHQRIAQRTQAFMATSLRVDSLPAGGAGGSTTRTSVARGLMHQTRGPGRRRPGHRRRIPRLPGHRPEGHGPDQGGGADQVVEFLGAAGDALGRGREGDRLSHSPAGREVGVGEATSMVTTPPPRAGWASRARMTSRRGHSPAPDPLGIELSPSRRRAGREPPRGRAPGRRDADEGSGSPGRPGLSSVVAGVCGGRSGMDPERLGGPPARQTRQQPDASLPAGGKADHRCSAQGPGEPPRSAVRPTRVGLRGAEITVAVAMSESARRGPR